MKGMGSALPRLRLQIKIYPLHNEELLEGTNARQALWLGFPCDITQL